MGEGEEIFNVFFGRINRNAAEDGEERGEMISGDRRLNDVGLGSGRGKPLRGGAAPWRPFL
jgi:hypothetical protein